MPIDTLIVLHAAREYETFHRRCMIEALAESLPQHWAILCINRPPTLDMLVRKSPRWWIHNRHQHRPDRVTDSLFVFRPRQIVHELIADRLPYAPDIHRLLLRRQLHRVIAELFGEVPRIISWIYHPVQRWVWGLLPNEKTVYECYDEYGLYPDGTPRPRWQREERHALARADLTFVPAELMAARRQSLAKRVVCFSNGVPATFLAIGDGSREPISHAGRPQIGYVGHLRQEVDIALVAGLAHENLQWEFVFIGPVQKPEFRNQLGRLPNVRFTGPHPHAALPQILRQLDVGLIPFQLNESTLVLNPLKTYEYMAAGVPIVSSNLPELYRFRHLIRFAENTPGAFTKAIEEILASDRAQLQRQLLATVRQFTWDHLSRTVVVPELVRLHDQ